MKAIVQNARGEPTDVLELVDIGDEFHLAADEVLVDVGLSPIHHGDLHLVRSGYDVPANPGQIRRGSEAVGTIRALGVEASRLGNLKVGDRVVGFPAVGSWAESVVIPVSAAIPVPAALSDEVAAQLFINYAAASMILRGLRRSVSEDALRDGAVLVTGASTVVARMLLYRLQMAGMRTIGLARSVASARRVEAEISAVQLAATEESDWQAQIISFAAGRKIVAVLDCVSGSLVGDYASLLADDAAIITYGGLAGGKIGLSGLQITDHQFLIRGVTFTRWFSELTREQQLEDIGSAIALVGELPSLFKVGGIYGLDDFQAAVLAVEKQNREGFILLKPSPKKSVV